MTLFKSMLYLHVLLFGFWIGADIAVLYVTRFILNRNLTPQVRALFGTIMFKLDTSPTVCMTLMLPVGLTLAAQMGMSPLTGSWLVLVWVVGLAWTACMLTMIHGKRPRPAFRLADRALRIALIVALVISGTWSLMYGTPFPARWLAIKALLFAVVVAASIGIDTAIRPYGPAMQKLVAEGPTPETERQLSRAFRTAYPFVYLMYGAILAEAAVVML